MMGDLLGEVLEAGVAIYIIDKVTGKRKKVYVTKQQAKKIRAAQKRKPAKKTTKRKSVRKSTRKVKRASSKTSRKKKR